jgi:hypothetical protein
MDKKYTCYCGLYCENCAVKVKVHPAAKALRAEMEKAGFGDVINLIPGGDGFWSFLTLMAENGMCVSCRDGSGNPGCAVRICAKEKGVEMCALCGSYPCEIFGEYFEGYPLLENDNVLLRDKGWEAWAKLQDERQASGFTYADDKSISAMVESRCGILCSDCDYREKMNCGGCINIDKPFWGESCPVKSCCEGRNIEHCGECNEFPCDLLNQFAFDKEQGDDGKRIEQCRKWQSRNRRKGG